MEFTYKCSADDLVVGIRRLNYGLYNVLVGFRNDKRKLNYYRIGSIRDGVVEMNGASSYPTRILLLLHSNTFQSVMDDVKNHALIDSVMME